MCGRLFRRARGQGVESLFPGAPITTINNSGQKITGKWNGFARKETLTPTWLDRGCNEVSLPEIGGFEEHGHSFELKDDQIMKAIITPQKQVKIVTRSPLNEKEKAIHHRWPVVKQNKGK